MYLRGRAFPDLKSDPSVEALMSAPVPTLRLREIHLLRVFQTVNVLECGLT